MMVVIGMNVTYMVFMMYSYQIIQVVSDGQFTDFDCMNPDNGRYGHFECLSHFEYHVLQHNNN